MPMISKIKLTPMQTAHLRAGTIELSTSINGLSNIANDDETETAKFFFTDVTTDNDDDDDDGN